MSNEALRKAVERLERLIPELEYSRETHVQWRDCDQSCRDANPQIGDAKFHAGAVDAYDERMAAISQAIKALRDQESDIERLQRDLDAGTEAGWHALRNERDTLRASLAVVEETRDKFMWQVRDTCTRAEKADAEIATHRANYDALVIRLGEVTARLEAAEKDAKALRYAKTATVEFDETIDGEHVGVIPFPHSAVGRKYKLVRITAHLGADHV